MLRKSVMLFGRATLKGTVDLLPFDELGDVNTVEDLFVVLVRVLSIFWACWYFRLNDNLAVDILQVAVIWERDIFEFGFHALERFCGVVGIKLAPSFTFPDEDACPHFPFVDKEFKFYLFNVHSFTLYIYLV